MDNWIRAYRLVVTGKTGFEVGNAEGEVHALKIDFSTELGNAENPNSLKLSVWNLSDEHVNMLENDTCKVELSVGYGKDGSNLQLIFIGDVTSVENEKDGGNVKTTIEALDGHKAIKDPNFDLSYKSAIGSQSVYQAIAGKMGCTIEFADDLEFKTFPEKFFFVGKSKGAMEKVTQFNGHKWSIQNGIIQVTNPNKPIRNTGFLISPETGLISIPKKYSEGEGKQQVAGWEVKSFMNPGIKVNNTVQVESKYLKGTFMVKSIEHKGSNLDGDWVSDMKLIKV